MFTQNNRPKEIFILCRYLQKFNKKIKNKIHDKKTKNIIETNFYHQNLCAFNKRKNQSALEILVKIFVFHALT